MGKIKRHCVHCEGVVEHFYILHNSTLIAPWRGAHTHPSLALTLGKLNWIAQKEPEIALIQNIERVLPKETNMKIEQHILYVSCYLDDCEKLGQSIKRYLRSHSGTMAAGYSDRATMTR